MYFILVLDVYFYPYMVRALAYDIYHDIIETNHTF